MKRGSKTQIRVKTSYLTQTPKRSLSKSVRYKYAIGLTFHIMQSFHIVFKFSLHKATQTLIRTSPALHRSCIKPDPVSTSNLQKLVQLCTDTSGK